MAITSHIENIDPELLPAIQARRPILHHLNADTTWLLQLPIPHPSPASRQWYNIILDPWLTGPQSDVASWFSKQWHAIDPALDSISAVNSLCDHIEHLSNPSYSGPKGKVDVVAISHEFTDHCHKETLLQLSPSTPIVASTKAVPLIESWNHFEKVIETPSFSDQDGGNDWGVTNIEGVLPEWVGIGRIVNGKDALYYHSAVSIMFQLEDDKPVESVIYSPHGITPISLSPIINAKPTIDVLAILHGLHDVSIDWGQQLNLGALNGVKVQQALDSKYWIGTHDEVKHGGGIVSWLLRRKVYSVGDALAHAEEENGEKLLGRGEYLELDNGAVAVLM